MSYLDDFEHSFMQHTLEIVRAYRGEYDATLLINCLLGLLIVPKETSLDAIPDDPLANLSKWGIDPHAISCHGQPTKKNPHPDTLRGLVHNLRNAVAHFRLTPVPRWGQVHSFEFTDQNGLHATIQLDQMRTFVERLADHLDKS